MSTQIIDFKTAFPHLNDEERRHFHACKLINEAIQVDRGMTKKVIEERFQLFIRMLESLDLAEQQTTPGESFRVLRRERQSSRWELVGPAHEAIESANAAASKVVLHSHPTGRPSAKELRQACVEEGMKYFELVKGEGSTIEVLVMRCGSVRRDSCGEEHQPDVEPE